MMKMITQNPLLLLKSSSSLLTLVVFFLLQTCESDAKQMMNCSSSSCGLIRNISFPFRLKHHPKHCGYPGYELACENNVTTIDLKSQKLHVLAINYKNFTIRLADASMTNNTFSFPQYSLYAYNFNHEYPYNIRDNSGGDVAWPINFISCPYPLKNSSSFLDASNGARHIYIKVGHMNASYVNQDMCGLEQIVLTSWKFEDLNNVSLSEIHQSLLYGFELSWIRYPCRKCKPRNECLLNTDHTAICLTAVLTPPFTLMRIIVVVLAWISTIAMIIIGLCTLPAYLSFSKISWWLIFFFGWLIFCFAKHVVVFCCVMWILINKFRRRHLSMFGAIERFLQSDNQLMPIRYSYSDIKRMTKGFQEKLGQGGYGSVYKGKLRSGHYVAVKLLGKAKGNGQDFMNEIATIGRIHHCNIVKLVGFCADRSKQALVYDFMSNGSLEKYIYSRDNMNSLSWEKKYEIAVGVARGIRYLHQGCDIQILHFDIKPHNILLDDKFIPKISDFGLAKVCSTDKKTVSLTAARGTIGYVAPELINRGIGGVSYKADVYSFGMLLIELLGLKRDLTGNNDQSSSQYFPNWIYKWLDQGKDIEIGIADDDENDRTRKIAQNMTLVALWCIQMSPDARPSMNKVVEMLEGEAVRPPRPSQSARVAVNEDQSWTAYSTDSVSLLSHHEITVEDV